MRAEYGPAAARFALSGVHGPAPSWTGAGAWAIVTAHNPRGEPAPGDQNRAWERRLGRLIAASGHASLAVVNGSGDWAEPARLIWGARLAEAVSWGRACAQAAVLWGSGARVALVWLEAGGVRIERFWTLSDFGRGNAPVDASEYPSPARRSV